jgi:acyl-CoA dehydrogenase
MDFSIPSTVVDVLPPVRELIEREVYPLEPALLASPFSQLVPRLTEIRQKVKQMGLWAPHIPRAHGGLGLTCLEYALVGEELGRSPLGHYVFNAQAPDAGNMEILREFATPEQRERWLAPLVAGEIRSCFAMTEPDHPGSNPVWMGTTAIRQGEDFVLNGRKWFASAADGARFAIVMAVTDASAEPHRRASMIIVPTDTPGFRRVRNISWTGPATPSLFSRTAAYLERTFWATWGLDLQWRRPGSAPGEFSTACAGSGFLDDRSS